MTRGNTHVRVGAEVMCSELFRINWPQPLSSYLWTTPLCARGFCPRPSSSFFFRKTALEHSAAAESQTWPSLLKIQAHHHKQLQHFSLKTVSFRYKASKFPSFSPNRVQNQSCPAATQGLWFFVRRWLASLLAFPAWSCLAGAPLLQSHRLFSAR